jgi:hypothetical protein
MRNIRFIADKRSYIKVSREDNNLLVKEKTLQKGWQELEKGFATEAFRWDLRASYMDLPWGTVLKGKGSRASPDLFNGICIFLLSK